MRTVSSPFAFATGNADKAREFLEMLTAHTQRAWVAEPRGDEDVTYCHVVTGVDGVTALRSLQLRHVPEVEEVAMTLAGNARIKALGIRDALGCTAIADDTGLHIDALHGEPGVRSARYAGPDATYAQNVNKALSAMQPFPEMEQRTARFQTVVHVAFAEGSEAVFEGVVEGWIAHEPRGAGTFGYDPIFVPREGDGRTFGEMTPEHKHELSHRGRAFRSLLEQCSFPFAH